MVDRFEPGKAYIAKQVDISDFAPNWTIGASQFFFAVRDDGTAVLVTGHAGDFKVVDSPNFMRIPPDALQDIPQRVLQEAGIDLEALISKADERAETPASEPPKTVLGRIVNGVFKTTALGAVVLQNSLNAVKSANFDKAFAEFMGAFSENLVVAAHTLGISSKDLKTITDDLQAIAEMANSGRLKQAGEELRTLQSLVEKGLSSSPPGKPEHGQKEVLALLRQVTGMLEKQAGL